MSQSLRRPHLILVGCLLAGAAGGFLAACASAKKPFSGSSCMVAAATSPFFKHGPSQGNGPDQLLPKGTHLTMMGHKYGYAQVTTDAGVTGYVPDRDIVSVPATPPPKIAAASPGPATRRNDLSPLPAEPPPPSAPGDLYDVPVPTLPVEGGKSKAP